MKRYSGGEKVPGGYYWSLAHWEIVPIRARVGALPGSPGDRYAELPLPAIPIVVVLMASMAMFFTPAIGFLMVFYALYAKLTGKAGGAAAKQDAAPGQAELPKG
ncbi:MAG TPA: hypothetical protein VGK67_24470 [Myxococcales bacterium]|jgi:hypothetical protein